MVYPTRRAILFAAAGAPLTLVLALAAPKAWLLGPAWLLMVLALVAADALLAPAARQVVLALNAPAVLAVGRDAAGRLTAEFPRGAPSRVEFAIAGDARLSPAPMRQAAPVQDRRAIAPLTLTALRRGEAFVDGLWARWAGPLGLAWVQASRGRQEPITIAPDIQGVKDEALRLFQRDAPLGARPHVETGEGTEFNALREFQTGMDLRTIDWKQSARHLKLLAKEHHIERNHQIVLALDTGRLMSAPLAGQPRIDRAINASLLLAFVALKLGDRAGLFAFDAKPRGAARAAGGPAAFPLLQRMAAGLDYSTEETNFTLGLTALAGQLDRRTLIAVFTDFADPTNAELMVENVARLVRRHLVLFVVMRDQELEDLAGAEPQDADDVSRAVVAGALLQQRELVLTRLRRLGVQIVEASADGVGPALVNSYLDAKRRDLL